MMKFSRLIAFLAAAITVTTLSGCKSFGKMPEVNFTINTAVENGVDVRSAVASHEGLVYLKINSEVHNNSIILENMDTKKRYRSEILKGRYNAVFTHLPAGKYRWTSFKLNKTFFTAKEKEYPEFEILAGKMNYPGDLDVVIWSRDSSALSVMIRYVDREDRLPRYLSNMKDYEFHYAKLIEEEEEDSE